MATTFKHGIGGYKNHNCRCDVCKSVAREKRRQETQRLYGTEPPEHGTGNAYGIYGCRCEVCSEWRRKSYKKYSDAWRGKVPPRHGATGYRVYGCRCDVCVSSRKKSDFKRRSNPVVVVEERERGWKRIGIKNFTYVDFCRMYEEQDGRCSICGISVVRDGKNGDDRCRVAHVDHDHDTGVVRSLLCHNCNKMLGTGRESRILRLGAEYLDHHDSKRLI